MHILVTNDDGYKAPGIQILAETLAAIATVTVVAPDRNCSGASSSLTLRHPLRTHISENGFHVVDGTPTDCVHLALTGLLDEKPDMVVSGINSGPNLGDDVIYSGTVAGAIEGRFLGLPALAVSLVGKPGEHYESAATVTANLIEKMRVEPMSSESILNINVPDIEYDKIDSVVATRLGFRHKAEAMTKDKDPYGSPIYWVGPPGEIQDAGEGTDFYAVSCNRVSVTPLQVDMTRHQSIKSLDHWLQINGANQ